MSVETDLVKPPEFRPPLTKEEFFEALDPTDRTNVLEVIDFVREVLNESLPEESPVSIYAVGNTTIPKEVLNTEPDNVHIVFRLEGDSDFNSQMNLAFDIKEGFDKSEELGQRFDFAFTHNYDIPTPRINEELGISFQPDTGRDVNVVLVFGRVLPGHQFIPEDVEENLDKLPEAFDRHMEALNRDLEKIDPSRQEFKRGQYAESWKKKLARVYIVKLD